MHMNNIHTLYIVLDIITYDLFPDELHMTYHVILNVDFVEISIYLFINR